MSKLFDCLDTKFRASEPSSSTFKARLEKELESCDARMTELASFFADKLASDERFKGFKFRDLEQLRHYRLFYKKYSETQKEVDLQAFDEWINSRSKAYKDKAKGEVVNEAINSLIETSALTHSPLENSGGKWRVISEVTLVPPEQIAFRLGFSLSILEEAGHYNPLTKDMYFESSTRQNPLKLFLHETTHALDHLGHDGYIADDPKMRSSDIINHIINHMQLNDERKERAVIGLLLNKISGIIGDPQLGARKDEYPHPEILAHTIPRLFDEWSVSDQDSSEANKVSILILHRILDDTHKNYINLGMSSPILNGVFKAKIDQLYSVVRSLGITEQTVEELARNVEYESSSQGSSSHTALPPATRRNHTFEWTSLPTNSPNLFGIAPLSSELSGRNEREGSVPQIEETHFRSSVDQCSRATQSRELIPRYMEPTISSIAKQRLTFEKMMIMRKTLEEKKSKSKKKTSTTPNPHYMEATISSTLKRKSSSQSR